MEEGEGGGQKLSKRFSDQVGGGSGEVDFKTKSGTAWSHNFLNQKPWHPLSYPNQRRKWIAEQTHANRQRRAEEVSREFNQEQEFFRQTALVSKKEKEKMEMMKAVSFMYVRPPGYNAESAKAAEVSDERKQQDPSEPQQDPTVEGTSTSMPLLTGRDQPRDEKKKRVPKDVFGRALPTEEQFEILKNAPRMETGAPARVKPFGVEVRNVKCLRCGTYGHQSGDRECPLKDAIMPNEESRLKRNDPLTAMLAHTDASEPLKWELKQKPGMSPPRGGFNPEDPNQQIVAEDIFDEYGGFLSGEIIPDLLANFSSEKPKKSKSKKKHGRRSSPTSTEPKNRKGEELLNDEDDRKRSKKRKHTAKKQNHSESSPSDNAELHKRAGSSDDENERKSSKKRNHDGKKHKRYESSSSEDAGFDRWRGSFNEDERKRSTKKNDKRTKRTHSESSSSEDAEYDRHCRRSRQGCSSPSEDLAYDGRRRSKHRHISCHRRHRNRSDSSSE